MLLPRQKNASLYPKNFLLKIFCAITTLILIPLILNAGDLFYETGKYVAYAKSFISDFDLNIINHVPEREAWLITKKYFHPDFHTDIQAPFILFTSLLEWILATFFNLKLTSVGLDHRLTTIIMNYFEFAVGMFFLSKLLRELKLKILTEDIIVFLLATPFLYLCLCKTTSLEVFSFPFISYLLYFLVINKKKFNPYTLGFAAGILMTLRLSFIPLPIFVIYRVYLNSNCSREYNFMFRFTASVMLVITSYFINFYTKYGALHDPNLLLLYFFDISFNGIYSKLIILFSSDLSMFVSTPFFILALLGCPGMLRRIRSSCHHFSLPSLVLFLPLATIVPGLILMGDFIEDGYPGRLIMRAAPVIFMSYIEFIHTRRKTYYYKFLLSFLILWQLAYLCYFLAITFKSPHLLAEKGKTISIFILELNKYGNYILRNINWIYSYKLEIFSFIFILSLLVLFLIKKNVLRKLVIISLSTSILLYSYMTVCNLTNSPKKIARLIDQGFFESKVIGNGNEIYTLDYFLDYAKYINARGIERLKPMTGSSVENFYQKIERQIIKTNPMLEEAIKKRDTDFSFLIQLVD